MSFANSSAAIQVATWQQKPKPSFALSGFRPPAPPAGNSISGPAGKNTMESVTSPVRPPLGTYQDLALMIDHSLIRPELTEDQVIQGCELAKGYAVTSVSVRPKDVDMVLNIGTLLSRQFQYVEMELLQAAEECHKQGALVKVILENAYLTDELKIVACRICGRAEVDFVKTSTACAPTGCTLEDLRLMRAHAPEHVGVKAAGGVRTLEKAPEVYQAGANRIGATATAAILDAWKARLEPGASHTAS